MCVHVIADARCGVLLRAEYVRKLTGRAADSTLLNQLTLLAFNHHPKIQKIDTVVCCGVARL